MKQTDHNGDSNYSSIIAIDNVINKIKYKIIDLNGREVEENTPGIIVKIYSNGSFQKIINIK